MRWLLWCFCLLVETYETINHYHLHGNDRHIQSFPTDLAMRKVNQSSFSIMDLLLVQISTICILLGILEYYVKCKWVYKCKHAVVFRKITKTTIKDPLVVIRYFQCIFAYLTTFSTHSPCSFQFLFLTER